jgi:small subunit ribosomal protein SAe
MSSLSPKEEDIKLLIVAGCHFGGKKITKQMKKYLYTVRSDGIAIFDVNKIYEKIQVAARIIASVDPDSVISVSGKPAGQRAVYKFGHFTKTQTVTGRWSPGMLTNQTTKKFIEPRLLIVTDPRTDYNAILESSYVNIPVIAICNTDNNLKYVDCAIPCNNRSSRAVAMIWYLLTKAVLEIKKDTENFEKNPSAYVNVELESKKKERRGKGDKEEEGEEEKEEEEEGEEEEGDENKDEDGNEEEGDEDGDGEEKFIE